LKPPAAAGGDIGITGRETFGSPEQFARFGWLTSDQGKSRESSSLVCAGKGAARQQEPGIIVTALMDQHIRIDGQPTRAVFFPSAPKLAEIMYFGSPILQQQGVTRKQSGVFVLLERCLLTIAEDQ
jgi:hypothetical protein